MEQLFWLVLCQFLSTGRGIGQFNQLNCRPVYLLILLLKLFYLKTRFKLLETHPTHSLDYPSKSFFFNPLRVKHRMSVVNQLLHINTKNTLFMYNSDVNTYWLFIYNLKYIYSAKVRLRFDPTVK